MAARQCHVNGTATAASMHATVVAGGNLRLQIRGGPRKYTFSTAPQSIGHPNEHLISVIQRPSFWYENLNQTTISYPSIGPQLDVPARIFSRGALNNKLQAARQCRVTGTATAASVPRQSAPPLGSSPSGNLQATPNPSRQGAREGGADYRLGPPGTDLGDGFSPAI
ncbi:hypothetical protein DFH09DRAFT_1073094 [Mycena vulgaris]|nr:hypothetical protein DFH09DRAFT_1073094 [Mycena vulgaris]